MVKMICANKPFTLQTKKSLHNAKEKTFTSPQKTKLSIHFTMQKTISPKQEKHNLSKTKTFTILCKTKTFT